MQYTVPHYYKNFQCTAERCEDTCCAGWQIVIDERTLKKYKNVKGPFGNRLYNSIEWKEGTFHQYEGRCAFLDENNLCDIYSELGPEMFCKTCRNYPRHIEEFPNVREISLSLSCMEAGRLILGCEEPVRFLTKETAKEETESEEFDDFLYDKLLTVRECAIRILQNRGENMGLRMALALGLAHDAQVQISRNQLFQVEDVCERYAAKDAPVRFLRKLITCRGSEEDRFYMMQELFDILDELEVLRKEWPSYIKGKREILYRNVGEYEKARKVFREKVVERNRYTEQLLVYFVFTYFCGGVYDGKGYSKMLMTVVSTLLIEELALGRFMEQGETLSFQDMVDVAHRFSREVEHSDENLETLEQIVVKKDFLWYNKLLCSELE